MARPERSLAVRSSSSAAAVKPADLHRWQAVDVLLVRAEADAAAKLRDACAAHDHEAIDAAIRSYDR